MSRPGVDLDRFSALLAAATVYEQRLRPEAEPTLDDLPRVLDEMGETARATLAVLERSKGKES